MVTEGRDHPASIGRCGLVECFLLAIRQREPIVDRGKRYSSGLFVLFHPQILREFSIRTLAKGATDLFCFQFLI
jgi:hypothetical protein